MKILVPISVGELFDKISIFFNKSASAYKDLEFTEAAKIIPFLS